MWLQLTAVLRVEFESSYEQSGPFGAKSIGEIVINTPSPALAHAVANATGIWVRELPITPEKIAMGTPEEQEKEVKISVFPYKKGKECEKDW